MELKFISNYYLSFIVPLLPPITNKRYEYQLQNIYKYIVSSNFHKKPDPNNPDHLAVYVKSYSQFHRLIKHNKLFNSIESNLPTTEIRSSPHFSLDLLTK